MKDFVLKFIILLLISCGIFFLQLLAGAGLGNLESGKTSAFLDGLFVAAFSIALLCIFLG